MNRPACSSQQIVKNGFTPKDKQKYKCAENLDKPITLVLLVLSAAEVSGVEALNASIIH